MKANPIEVFVGLFAIAAVLFAGVFAIRFMQGNVLAEGYLLYADFASVSGLNIGDDVEIAGVKVGEVASIKLVDYRARVALRMQEGVAIHENATASIETENLIGDRSLSIDPGISGKALGPGGEIKNTRSAQTFQDLVGELVAGNVFGD
jgi:phospholipid/cholesterol/gamma-HCH transport system substrate-binding protein